MPLSSVLGAASVIKAGVVTSTTRPSSPYVGQLIYESDTSRLAAYNGSAWTTQNGLQLIKAQTIGTAVSSVTVSDVFSANYDNYKILLSGGVGSTDANLTLTLGSSSTGYYDGGAVWAYTPLAQTSVSDINASSFTRAGQMTVNGLSADITLLNPFANARTGFNSWYFSHTSGGYGGIIAGFHNVATSYTSFTFTCSTGNITGGTIRVYGYANN
jgi:hypothetical protein